MEMPQRKDESLGKEQGVKNILKLSMVRFNDVERKNEI